MDSDTGLIVCDSVIDNQAYNNYAYADSYNGYFYGDADKTHCASNWEHSSLRAWLNDDFLNTAFTTTQQDKIQTLKRENKSTKNMQYDSNSTADKITLLSYWDVTNIGYGFKSNAEAEDAARLFTATDYAKCQGCTSLTTNRYGEKTTWWLRTSYDSAYASAVNHIGTFSNLYTYTTEGILPALNLSDFNLGSTDLLGDLNSDGEINSSDALLILRHSVGDITLTQEKAYLADVTKDGTANSLDALQILRYSVGEITSFN